MLTQDLGELGAGLGLVHQEEPCDQQDYGEGRVEHRREATGVVEESEQRGAVAGPLDAAEHRVQRRAPADPQDRGQDVDREQEVVQAQKSWFFDCRDTAYRRVA